MRRYAVRRPSPAMVVACIALLVALGGTSIAAVSQVANNSVGANQLKSNAVTTPKIKNNAVVAAKIASNAVVAAKIASNAVTAPKIAANAVTGAKVQDGSLAAADFAAGALPAPTSSFARFVNGPVQVPDALSEITNVAVPQAGNYVIVGKAVVSGAGTVTCRLEAGTDTDESAANATNSTPATISNLVVHNFTAAGTVSFRCVRSALFAATLSQVKIAAIGVQNLTNSG